MNSPISYGFLTVFHFLSARFFNFFFRIINITQLGKFRKLPSGNLGLPNWGLWDSMV